MPHTVKRRGTMETYRNEEQMQCLAKSEGCSTLPVSLYLADRGAGGACGDAFDVAGRIAGKA